jgi:hypothetical protein
MIGIISSAERDFVGERAKVGNDSNYVLPSHQVVVGCRWKYCVSKGKGNHVNF